MCLHLEPGLDLEPAFPHQPRKGRAKLAASRQLVFGAAAEGLLRFVAAHQPDHLRAGRFLLEAYELDQRADGRMAAAQHRDRLARIPRPLTAQHVGIA